MSKLTGERVNGIKTGYWSPSKKDDLVQKLGAIEHKAHELKIEICVYACRFPSSERILMDNGLCKSCPLIKLMSMID